MHFPCRVTWAVGLCAAAALRAPRSYTGQSYVELAAAPAHARHGDAGQPRRHEPATRPPRGDSARSSKAAPGLAPKAAPPGASLAGTGKPRVATPTELSTEEEEDWHGESSWLREGEKIRVYIYDLKGTDFTAGASGCSTYSFEHTFRNLLSASKVHRVRDPRVADYFYIPVDMCSIRARWFSLKGKLEHFNKLDQRVVEQMRAVGQYWDRRPERHIVSACRCPSSPARADQFNPQLWGRNTTLHLCVETRPTRRMSEVPEMDRRRSLHVGYHESQINLSPNLAESSAQRDVLAVYMGAPINKYRREISAWMNTSCQDCLSFDLEVHTVLSQEVAERYHAALRRTRFSVEPPGDTLERVSRDVSILSGAIPVILDFPKPMPQQILPWAPILNWSDFSVTFPLTEEEAFGNQSFTPRLESLLRELLTSGEADRLYRGVAHARSLVRWTQNGGLSTVMGMLAWRKAGMPGRPVESPPGGGRAP